MIVAIVQCGAKKRMRAAPARDLYCGSLFVSLRAAAERISDRWFIASAKHGLIEPGRVLCPYDQTLPAAGDAVWGGRILEQLRAAVPALEGQRVVALCSRRYLVGWAAEVRAETPILGLPIGKAIQRASSMRRKNQ